MRILHSFGFALRAAPASLATIVFSMLAGCVSAPLAPRLTQVQRERLSELPLPYSVGVAPYVYPVYSEKLTAALKASGVFSQVAPLGDFTRPPDLIATVEKSVHGTAVIPALTFITAGVVPTVVQEDHGFVFSLAPSARKSQKTMVGTTAIARGRFGEGRVICFSPHPEMTEGLEVFVQDAITYVNRKRAGK